LTKFKPPSTLLSQRQWQVVRLRATGLTQLQVAKRLHTSRENISIIEHRAYENVKAAKATLETLEQITDSRELIIPSGTSIFEATSTILRKGDMLRTKLKINADSILAMLRTQCKHKIRGHHLTSAIRVEVAENGSVRMK